MDMINRPIIWSYTVVEVTKVAWVSIYLWTVTLWACLYCYNEKLAIPRVIKNVSTVDVHAWANSSRCESTFKLSMHLDLYMPWFVWFYRILICVPFLWLSYIFQNTNNNIVNLITWFCDNSLGTYLHVCTYLFFSNLKVHLTFNRGSIRSYYWL